MFVLITHNAFKKKKLNRLCIYSFIKIFNFIFASLPDLLNKKSYFRPIILSYLSHFTFTFFFKLKTVIMKKLYCKVISTFLFFFFLQNFSHAQIGWQINTGVIVGSPIMSPIPEGATGKPGWGVNLGTEIRIPLLDKLMFHGGIAYAVKGSEYTSPIEGKYDVAEGVLGIELPFPLEANYTGDVEGKFKNTYLDFPIYVNYRILKRLSLSAGFQYSKLLNGSMTGTVDVNTLLFLNFNDQPFDQSELIKKNDKALLGEINFLILNNLNLKFRGTYGLNQILTEDPSGLGNPRNIYLGVMLSYRVF